MQNFVQFNGFSGCPYCLHRGTSVNTSARGHTHAYPFNRENPVKGYGAERTHEETLQHAYEAHKSKLEGKYAPVCGLKGYSWFMFFPGFDIIKGIAVDYMNCVIWGVTKMLSTLWFDKAHAAEDSNVSKRLRAVYRRLLNITPPNFQDPQEVFFLQKIFPPGKLRNSGHFYSFMLSHVSGTFCQMNTFSILFCLWKQSGCWIKVQFHRTVCRKQESC